MALAFSALALLLGTSTKAQAHNAAAVKACPGHVQGVYFYRGRTRQWEKKLGRQPSKSSFNASTIHSCKYVVWVAHHWRARAAWTHGEYIDHVRERQQQMQVALGELTADWACIHRYEGAWNANTGNGYYGGLQMDLVFQSSYGSEFLARWGTADNWPVWAQITAANRAKASGRGYGPWPNTARVCGLT